jgi:hypothetical protein
LSSPSLAALSLETAASERDGAAEDALDLSLEALSLDTGPLSDYGPVSAINKKVAQRPVNQRPIGVDNKYPRHAASSLPPGSMWLMPYPDSPWFAEQQRLSDYIGAPVDRVYGDMPWEAMQSMFVAPDPSQRGMLVHFEPNDRYMLPGTTTPQQINPDAPREVYPYDYFAKHMFTRYVDRLRDAVSGGTSPSSDQEKQDLLQSCALYTRKRNFFTDLIHTLSVVVAGLVDIDTPENTTTALLFANVDRAARAVFSARTPNGPNYARRLTGFRLAARMAVWREQPSRAQDVDMGHVHQAINTVTALRDEFRSSALKRFRTGVLTEQAERKARKDAILQRFEGNYHTQVYHDLADHLLELLFEPMQENGNRKALGYWPSFWDEPRATMSFAERPFVWIYRA